MATASSNKTTAIPATKASTNNSLKSKKIEISSSVRNPSTSKIVKQPNTVQKMRKQPVTATKEENTGQGLKAGRPTKLTEEELCLFLKKPAISKSMKSLPETTGNNNIPPPAVQLFRPS